MEDKILDIVEDIMEVYLEEFQEALPGHFHDQILIVNEELFLRCPNWDTIVSLQSKTLIN